MLIDSITTLTTFGNIGKSHEYGWEIVSKFHENYCFMMTFETFSRLEIDNQSSVFILINDEGSVLKRNGELIMNVKLKSDIKDLRLRFLYKDLFIASRSDNILILEATKYSKNLNILALHAQELGKDVFVLPGRIDSISSVGSNRLIFDGASPLYSLDLLKT